jgi:hypothetical protein
LVRADLLIQVQEAITSRRDLGTTQRYMHLSPAAVAKFERARIAERVALGWRGPEHKGGI